MPNERNDSVAEVAPAGDRSTRRRILQRHHEELKERIRQLEHAERMVEHAIHCRADDYTKCPTFRALLREQWS